MLSAEAMRALSGGDLAATIAGTLGSTYANHQFNTHFASSSSSPAFRNTGEISYERDGDETHIALVDTNVARVQQDMETVRQAGNRLARNLQTFLETAPEDLKPQLETLQQTNELLEEAGMPEQQREDILENPDISEAIQVSKAIENAQKEKIRGIENRNRKGKAPINEPLEPVLLNQEELNEVAGNLTLARLYKDGEEGGHAVETHQLTPASGETTVTQDALSTLVRGHQALVRAMEENPEKAQALQTVASQIFNTIDLMGYISAGAQGAMMGMASGFASEGISGIVPGGLMGAGAGMYLYHETGEVIGNLMESGADQISDLAYNQGRTLEESVKFKNSTQQLLLMGATGYIMECVGISAFDV